MDEYYFLNTILKKGILVKLFYYEKSNLNVKKFVFLYKGEWLNFLNIQDSVDDNAIINISLNEAFELQDKVLDIVEYVCFPKNIMLQDIIDPSPTFQKLGDYFLKYNKEYMKEVRKEIIQYKLHYKENLEKYLKDLKENEPKKFQDILILRFYPQKNFEKFKTIKEIEDDIKNKYFIIGEQIDLLPNDKAGTILALTKLGTSSSNFDVTDEIYLDALKRQWFRLITDEKEILYQKLENVKDFSLSEEELEEYKEELEIFKKEIDSVSMDVFKDFKTVKEVISYWPEMLQPKPDFVYED